MIHIIFNVCTCTNMEFYTVAKGKLHSRISATNVFLFVQKGNYHYKYKIFEFKFHKVPPFATILFTL